MVHKDQESFCEALHWGSGLSIQRRYFCMLKCISCKLIEVGTSPWLLKFESDKTGSIKLEDMYNLKEFVSFKPVYGLKKVKPIEDAHLLTIERFNSILKTLEEPNMSTVIILTTSKNRLYPKNN